MSDGIFHWQVPGWNTYTPTLSHVFSYALVTVTLTQKSVNSTVTGRSHSLVQRWIGPTVTDRRADTDTVGAYALCFPNWAWSGSREQFLPCELRKFRHIKSSVYRWYPQLVRGRFVYDTYRTREVTLSLMMMIASWLSAHVYYTLPHCNPPTS